MTTCLVVDDSSIIRKIARRILEGLNFQVIEAEDGVDGTGPLQTCHAGSGAARLEHARDGRLPLPSASAPHARRRRAQGGVLHHRERHRAHLARARRRCQRIHHEAVRQGHRGGQVPGSRFDRGDRLGRVAVARSDVDSYVTGDIAFATEVAMSSESSLLREAARDPARLRIPAQTPEGPFRSRSVCRQTISDRKPFAAAGTESRPGRHPRTRAENEGRIEPRSSPRWSRP